MPIQLTERFVRQYYIVGFAAYYHGKTVASAKSFDKLAKNSAVQKLLGKEGFVIKHTVPEGMIAVY